MQLNELFQQTHRMPSIPKIVQELIQSFSDENINLSKVGDKIAQDPVISAKVLRLANSARFGLPRKVTSVSDAVVLLGFNSLRTLVLASGVTGAFPAVAGIDKKQFWGDTFGVAAAAKAIARKLPKSLNPETAFTCGLLHNIGELLLNVVIPEEMAKVAAACAAGGERRQTQQNLLGFDFAQVGAGLAALWHFPEEIQTAIARQQEPLAATNVDDLACVLQLAVRVNRHLHDASDAPLELPAELVDYLQVDIEALLQDEARIRESAGAFDELIA